MTYSALNIPEVLFHVGLFLDSNSALVCLRVCKDWHHTFMPFLWRTLVLTQHKSPPIDSLANNAHYVHALILQGFVLTEEYSPPARLINLHYLSLDVGREPSHMSSYSAHTSSQAWRKDPTYAATHDRQLSKLIRQNRHLSEIRAESPWPQLGEHFWHAIFDCDHVAALSLKSIPQMSAGNCGYLWQAGRHLESISFEGMSIPGTVAMIPEDCRIHTAVLRNMYGQAAEAAIERLKHLPALKHLHLWPSLAGKWLQTRTPQQIAAAEQALADGTAVPTTPETIASLMASKTWPSIESLDFDGSGWKDESISSTLNLMKRVEQLCIPGSHFGTLSFQSLSRYFRTVRFLDVKGSNAVSSDMVQTLLTSCPMLETFAADSLCVSVVMASIEKRPWVCLDLKVLRLDIGIMHSLEYDDEANEECHEYIYTQLSSLSKLEVLDLRSKSDIMKTVDRTNQSFTPYSHYSNSHYSNIANMGSNIHSNFYYSTGAFGGGGLNRPYSSSPNQDSLFLGGGYNSQTGQFGRYSSSPYATPSVTTPNSSSASNTGGTRGPIQPCTNEYGLQLLLCRGMGHLKKNRRLHTLLFTDAQEMGEVEVEWIQRHWPRMMEIRGIYNTDSEDNWKLVMLLQSSLGNSGRNY